MTVPTMRPTSVEPTTSHSSRAALVQSLSTRLAFRRLSGLYIWVLLMLFFSWRVPHTFLSLSTARGVLSEQAISLMAALGLLFPLAAGVFDVSVGYAVGLGALLSAWLTTEHGLSTPVMMIAVALAGLVVGLVNSLVIVRWKVNSFIATLGMSSVLQAVILKLSDNQQIVGLPASFQSLSRRQLWTLPTPIYLVAILAVLGWYVLEHTPFGRFVYATGGGREAARLSGVKTDRLATSSLMISATVAALAGALLTSQLGSGSPSVGPPYLLPVFAAAFLGSTQIKPGRVNVPGTVVAVLLLATGVKGLQLMGVSFWVTDLFNGLALIVAVALSTRTVGRAAIG